MKKYYKEMLKLTIAMYDEQENDPRFKKRNWYFKNIEGLPNFAVRKFVYSPDHINVSLFWPKWFCENDKIKGKSFLEIGTGTGFVALFCALHGNPKRVVATDISPFAFENCQKNALRYKLNETSSPSFSIRKGSIFGPIKTDEKFDIIFYAFPWNCPDKEIAEILKDRSRESDANRPEKIIQLMAGLDPNYNFLREFIRNAKKYLNPDGKVILGAGEFSRHDIIKEEAEKAGFSIKIPKREKVRVVKSSDEWVLDCIIYELTSKK